ncbi:hypothetical protein RclHR1_16680002 [Rhizophagus clarus]|uniref:F-box domain-containing protein n=1 Tax=Rhizophagus clarus TaxID=94130 RepID=A0A2Z6QI36_9GLOM|nr:hypothetical protein RclHR1_16680002 [Rhizophagus clarus]GES81927.1 hypothetical protein GLOIN_2v1638741 [Rhizophagus clarus]
MSTTTPKIINDCILEILLYLTDDHYTLYNCIQVNRDWCQLAIPLLWMNPFKFENFKNFKIIQTLIQNFDVQSKDQLLRKRVFNSSPLLSSLFSTLFNYSSFIQHFDFSTFKISVRDWLFKLLNKNPKYDEMVFVYQLVGSHIFKNTRGFVSLNIVYDHTKINDDFDYFGDPGEIFDDEVTSNFSEIYDISRFGYFENAMKNLESFTFSYRGLEPTYHQKDFIKAISGIFKKLILYCNNIQNLIIHSGVDNEFFEHINFVRKLTSGIILNQQNLQFVSFLEEWRDDNGPDTFFSTLTKYQKTRNSLRSLKFPYFSDIGGLLPFLAINHSLETLEFTNSFCDYDVIDYCTSNENNMAPIYIKNLKFYRIKFDSMYNKNNYIKAVEVLLHLSKDNLQTLIVEYVNDTIIQSISDYCNNSLTYLSLKIFPKYFYKFVDILSSLNNLKHLILVEDLKNSRIKYNCSIQSFVKSFPSSLRHLGLDISINPKILGLLLDEIEVPITTLDLYTVMDFGYLEAIVKYIKINNSNLKNLGFNSFIDSSLNNNRSLHNYMRLISALYNFEISIYIVEKHLHGESQHGEIWFV